jgi:hypothetical protein
VAEDPRKIMAALVHDHLIPKAQLQNHNQNQHQHHIKIQPQLRSNNSKTISHILAATTLSTPCDNPKQTNQPTPTISPINNHNSNQHQ